MPKRKQSDDNPTEELNLALLDFKPTDARSVARLKEAAAGVVSQLPLDLKSMPEEELLSTDTIAENRRLYVAALLRLWNFISRPPETMSEEEGQARLAMNFIKHVEGSKSMSIHLGRTKQDGKLQEEVDDLKRELEAMVKDKLTIDVAPAPLGSDDE